MFNLVFYTFSESRCYFFDTLCLDYVFFPICVITFLGFDYSKNVSFFMILNWWSFCFYSHVSLESNVLSTICCFGFTVHHSHSIYMLFVSSSPFLLCIFVLFHNWSLQCRVSANLRIPPKMLILKMEIIFL